MLYLIEILHQTTTCPSVAYGSLRCILSKFYIKPQLKPEDEVMRSSCILSKFYIKPQPNVLLIKFFFVVSYRNSTSNHNLREDAAKRIMLYLIEILHQTTTIAVKSELLSRCILSKFYIKPQHAFALLRVDHRCILSKFYIKPQLARLFIEGVAVVSYRNSTSNHNPPQAPVRERPVVSYRNSTSNHNFSTDSSSESGVVSYRNSTSNHNFVSNVSLLVVVVSYRNSTSNHNLLQEFVNC